MELVQDSVVNITDSVYSLSGPTTELTFQTCEFTVTDCGRIGVGKSIWNEMGYLS